MKDIDERYITKEFLGKYFPAFFNFSDGRLETSKQLYIKFKENINSGRRKSGHSSLGDADLSWVIEEYFKVNQ